MGSAIALACPAAALLVASAASARDQGAASGLLTTCQQAGSAPGVAAVTALESAGDGTALQGCLACAAVTWAACAWLLRRPAAKA
ncbi:hypothetical protein [Streptomyces sp. TRM68416]|uniref:hypothetical protein n=1 Tax=Streptomyces sp. TRM68416 TaxID=2758412 RepID=UPI001661ECC4|nr:hypothetical protein [Streptomyces sp. TRM68416]MBD0839987.1 hypothetical protein [Streptomyces sp. TRM68416]